MHNLTRFHKTHPGYVAGDSSTPGVVMEWTNVEEVYGLSCNIVLQHRRRTY